MPPFPPPPFWFLFLCLSATASLPLAPASPQTDSAALLAFKSSILSDPSGALSQWSSSDSNKTCSWRGVACDSGGSVVGLNLTAASLSGSIAAEAFEGGALSGLKELRLGHNNFTGEIPATLAELGELEVLELDHNGLQGIIPGEMARLSNLTSLDLSFNALVGQIPQLAPFTAFPAAVYSGNVALCGVPLAPCQGYV